MYLYLFAKTNWVWVFFFVNSNKVAAKNKLIHFLIVKITRMNKIYQEVGRMAANHKVPSTHSVITNISIDIYRPSTYNYI